MRLNNTFLWIERDSHFLFVKLVKWKIRLTPKIRIFDLGGLRGADSKKFLKSILFKKIFAKSKDTEICKKGPHVQCKQKEYRNKSI